MTLADLLAELTGALVEDRRCEATMAVLVLKFPDGRRLMLLERTYREGLAAIIDPNSHELAAASEGDLWGLWNSDRATRLEGLAYI